MRSAFQVSSYNGLVGKFPILLEAVLVLSFITVKKQLLKITAFPREWWLKGESSDFNSIDTKHVICILFLIKK